MRRRSWTARGTRAGVSTQPLDPAHGGRPAGAGPAPSEPGAWGAPGGGPLPHLKVVLRGRGRPAQRRGGVSGQRGQWEQEPISES